VIVAGVGFRSGTSAEEIERVVRLALGVFELPVERLEVMTTESAKATDPAFAEAARCLSVTMTGCTLDDLDRVEPLVRIHRDRHQPNPAGHHDLPTSNR